ncbi:MAG: metal-dependent transcriptional regulator [Planctomycetes bacterium]|nr:metal-dependent transcriptional regulator [Planctomycetota bacterium]
MNDKIDEILELLYITDERGGSLAEAGIWPEARNLLNSMAADGLVEIGDDGPLAMTNAGRARAEQIIRLHRLAERLLEDVLELSPSVAEEGACQFEHCLSTDVADSICTLLGHPTTCPHGRPIPRGECCRREKRGVEPVVVPLSELESGKDARVLYIGTKHHDRLDRLTSMGVLPGAELRLHQRRPTFVIQLGETTLALDQSIAQDIFVRRKADRAKKAMGQ